MGPLGQVATVQATTRQQSQAEVMTRANRTALVPGTFADDAYVPSHRNRIEHGTIRLEPMNCRTARSSIYAYSVRLWVIDCRRSLP